MAMGRERFNYQDAGLVNFDRDSFPHNIGSAGIFDGSIPFERYLLHVEERLNRVPRYRQRMLQAPLRLANPVWHDDPAFDLRRHVRSVKLPGPGDESQLSRLAGEFFAEPLDRERPLWQILLVQGLQGDRTAQLVKAHHCLVDGVGGVQLLIALLDSTPEPTRDPPGERHEPEPLPDAATRLVDAVCDQLLDQVDAAESLALTLVRPASALRWGRSVGRALWAARPYISQRAPESPWNLRLTSPRRLAWQSVPLAEAREVCSALDGKVNDLVLTILSGALRRYFQLHDWETDGVVLRVAVPVNVRRDSEARELGNHVSIMLAGLPLGEADPTARFRTISNEMTLLKEAKQADGIQDLLRFAGRIPAPVQAALGRHVSAPNIFTNLLCTNVRGPETPLFCLGHRMTAHYPWVLATWRMGLGVAVMSYLDQLSFSFTGDAAVLHDVDRIAVFLADDFRDLHRAVAKPGVTAPPALREEAPAAPSEATTIEPGAPSAVLPSPHDGGEPSGTNGQSSAPSIPSIVDGGRDRAEESP